MKASTYTGKKQGVMFATVCSSINNLCTLSWTGDDSWVFQVTSQLFGGDESKRSAKADGRFHPRIPE